MTTSHAGNHLIGQPHESTFQSHSLFSVFSLALLLSDLLVLGQSGWSDLDEYFGTELNYDVEYDSLALGRAELLPAGGYRITSRMMI